MTAAELLAALQNRGVTLTAAGGKLKARPASALDDATLELLKQHKAELLALLDAHKTDPETLEPPPPDLPAAVVELLLRHYAGDFDPRVRTRLDQIFASDPPDAIERLERAAAFLGLTGAGLAEAEERAMARHREVN